MKTVFKAVLIILFLTVIIGFLLSRINKTVEPEIILSQEQLEVKAPYGITIKTDDIKRVTLRDDIPAIEKKINGLDSLKSLSGSFRLKEFGDGYVYLGSRKKGPAVMVELSKGYILINSKDEFKTLEMQKKLSEGIRFFNRP